MPTNTFSKKLIRWHGKHGRKHFPWQENKTPYRVWVSEIMLQQTQVTTVTPYYLKFMETFPDIQDLANADIDKVLHLWTGLGYYTRARNLHKTAQQIQSKFSGKFPTDIDDVITLPGIGRSTAGAILAFSQHQRHPILDGNVKRVLTRFNAIVGFPGQRQNELALWELADTLTPKKDVAIYTQAIMDLGATVCTRTKPRCDECPMEKECKARITDTTHLYPEKKPKKTTPTKRTLFIIPLHKGKVLLHKRPDDGIWGGLWSFIETSEEQLESLTLHCQNQLGLEISRLEALPPIKHTFSHYHLIATPVIAHATKKSYLAMEGHTTRWFDLDSPFTIGLAAPIKKILIDLNTKIEETIL
jgi:A/G-specific adenine glycosylase